MSAPVEFQTDPEYVFRERPQSMGAPMGDYTWHSTMAIDLRWVAGAHPIGDFTEILLAGSPRWLSINVPYPKFMEMWTGHMEAMQPPEPNWGEIALAIRRSGPVTVA